MDVTTVGRVAGSELPKHHVSVAGVVVDADGRVLVIRRRDTGEWQIPGGVLEPAEPIDAGLVREVEEETGIRVRPDRLTGVYKNVVREVVSLVYLCMPVGGVARTSEESSAVDWVELAHARELLDDMFWLRVSDALSDEVHTRTHDGNQLLEPSSP